MAACVLFDTGNKNYREIHDTLLIIGRTHQDKQNLFTDIHSIFQAKKSYEPEEYQNFLYPLKNLPRYEKCN